MKTNPILAATTPAAAAAHAQVSAPDFPSPASAAPPLSESAPMRFASGEASIFSGACDASGVVDIGGKRFAAGTDERNTVRVFEADGNGQAVATLSLDEFLDAKWDEEDQAYSECDIEGATRIGDLTLWITSHGRNSKGKEKPERRRLFALRIVPGNPGAPLEPCGKPYAGLLADLLQAPELKEWHLAEAAKKPPQEKDGLNIETICATPQGGVWVGFRNPIRKGKALLVEIKNPLDLVKNPSAQAKAGNGRMLDLGGRGFRDMVPWRDGYLILGGAYDDKRKFALFYWKGNDETPERLPVDLDATGLSPEGLVVFPGDDRRVLILSDDDSLRFGGILNKDLPEGRRTFRGRLMNLPL
ncbi:MAG TPA: DUF3616 domain-containing protein [Chthoniobacterales bacterium]